MKKRKKKANSQTATQFKLSTFIFYFSVVFLYVLRIVRMKFSACLRQYHEVLFDQTIADNESISVQFEANTAMSHKIRTKNT